MTDDLLRQNSVTIGGELVLRMDLLGLRIEGGAFMDQVCRAHRDRSRRHHRNRRERRNRRVPAVGGITEGYGAR